MQISLGQSLVWDPVSGAAAYDVVLLNDTLGQELLTTEVSFPEIDADVLLAGRVAGNFYAKVRAKNATFVGPFCAPVALEFISLTAPQNLRVE